MSMYTFGGIDEETFERPLQIVARRLRERSAERRRPPPITTQTHVSVRRRHVNPVPSVELLNAGHTQRTKRSAATAAAAVLGVAVLTVDDITPEERADAATYFEAVDPDGAPWMEGLSQSRSHRSGSPASPQLSRRTVSCANAGARSGSEGSEAAGLPSRMATEGSPGLASQNTFLISREASEAAHDANERSASGDSADETATKEWPAFASFGASKVVRDPIRTPTTPAALTTNTPASHKKLKKAKNSSADLLEAILRSTYTPPSDVNLNFTRESSAMPSGAAAAAAAAANAPPQRSKSDIITRKTKPAKKRVVKPFDEATIVFSDHCVAAMPSSTVTAFASAFHPEQNGVLVHAVLPRCGPRSAPLQLITNADGAARRTADNAPIFTARPNRLGLNATATAVPGNRRRSVDRAMVMHSDPLDEHVLQCAHEAKACQRPRFRRRNSFEVYGRGCYISAE